MLGRIPMPAPNDRYNAPASIDTTSRTFARPLTRELNEAISIPPLSASVSPLPRPWNSAHLSSFSGIYDGQPQKDTRRAHFAAFDPFASSFFFFFFFSPFFPLLTPSRRHQEASAVNRQQRQRRDIPPLLQKKRERERENVRRLHGFSLQ